VDQQQPLKAAETMIGDYESQIAMNDKVIKELMGEKNSPKINLRKAKNKSKAMK
jgi:hypothetical protein